MLRVNQMIKHSKKKGGETRPREAGLRELRVEQIVEAAVNGSLQQDNRQGESPHFVADMLDYDVSKTRVVIMGGGTGLSTVVGGNSKLANWTESPYVGLKQVFPCLDVVVCTTDDGGSTGKLLQGLPMIAIGDLRKSCLSLITEKRLCQIYGISERQALRVVRLLQRIFNHRFPDAGDFAALLSDPIQLLPASWRQNCPDKLARELQSLGEWISSDGDGPTISPNGHCLGNLLLASAIFRETRSGAETPPGSGAIRRGLDMVSRLIGGAPSGRLHAMTSVPGQLCFEYANGVEVYGQSKSAIARRGFPVRAVKAEFVKPPAISAALRKAISQADLIIYAPGSLYTSIIPVLQLPEIASAIRQNRRAMKVLAANFWIQEGETDISLRNEARGLRVSELIDAYDRNIAGGVRDLFDLILSANLEQIPGSVLREYALEGKAPIFLDRTRVEAMGFESVEATLFQHEHVHEHQALHHDAAYFALAVRALLYADHRFSRGKQQQRAKRKKPSPAHIPTAQSQLLCHYYRDCRESLGAKDIASLDLRRTLLKLIWRNRDITTDHLNYFNGVQVIPAVNWHRKQEWDNVLGYFDPSDGFLKLHKKLLTDPHRLEADLLTSLGESLLGNYIESRHWHNLQQFDARCFEIKLRPAAERHCFFTDEQLHRYLQLTHMVQDQHDALKYRILLNRSEQFLPPGLLCGLFFAWYLDNTYGGIIEYEMYLLHWNSDALIPHQKREHERKQGLVDFFRETVFRHG